MQPAKQMLDTHTAIQTCVTRSKRTIDGLMPAPFANSGTDTNDQHGDAHGDDGDAVDSVIRTTRPLMPHQSFTAVTNFDVSENNDNDCGDDSQGDDAILTMSCS